jgi:hypothetical protein
MMMCVFYFIRIAHFFHMNYESTFRNDCGEEIVIMCYPIDSSQWISSNDQYSVPPGAEVVTRSYEHGANVHVYRRGLADLISIRTRLTSGYGILVPSGSDIAITKSEDGCKFSPKLEAEVFAAPRTEVLPQVEVSLFDFR